MRIKNSSPGRALFIDDVELPGMVHAAFLRSQVAHARIKKYRCLPGAEAPRCHRGLYGRQISAPTGSPDRCWCRRRRFAGIVFNARTHVPLAKDKIRHVGEPLAVVVAESRYIAEDALDDIEVDLEILPAVVDLEKALDAGSALVCTTISGQQCRRACPPDQGRLSPTPRRKRI